MKLTNLFGKNTSPVYDLDHNRISGMRATDGRQYTHQKSQTDSWVVVSLTEKCDVGSHTMNILIDIPEVCFSFSVELDKLPLYGRLTRTRWRRSRTTVASSTVRLAIQVVGEAQDGDCTEAANPVRVCGKPRPIWGAETRA